MLCGYHQLLFFVRKELRAEFGNVQEEMVARANNHFRRLEA